MPLPQRFLQIALGTTLVMVLSACGSTRSYDKEASSTLGAASSGNIDSALAQHEAQAPSGDKDLLYHLEKGQLLQLKGDLPKSTASWLSADEKVRLWEEEYKTNPDKFFGDVGSFILNDKTRRYDGYDYEKVFLSTFLAINHAAGGRWDLARVEVKKTHEREDLIAEVRAKTYEKLETDAKDAGKQPTFKELKGYPVETLEDPEVLGMKNSYQNALSHYLSGFVYESLGEISLAAPAYRKAIELKPNVPLLEQGLSGLDGRRSRAKRGETDVLFVVAAGNAPGRESVAIPFPFFWKGGLNYTQVSFPVIKAASPVDLPGRLMVGNRTVPTSAIANVEAMARRSLRDDMPGIILRTAIRAIAKGAAQRELSDRGGLLGAVVGAVAVAVTEQADERIWRSLPARLAIARATLPAGQHTLSIPGAFGNKSFELTVGGRTMIVPVRIMQGGVYFLQPSTTMAEEVPSTAPPATPVAPTLAPAPDNKQKKKPAAKPKPDAKPKSDPKPDAKKPATAS